MMYIFVGISFWVVYFYSLYIVSLYLLKQTAEGILFCMFIYV